MQDTQPDFDIQGFLKNLTSSPGIYRMLDSHGDIIYIGKAKNLKKRVSSYFSGGQTTSKQRVMVAKIVAIDVTITETESDALVLESQQIKRHKPRYNICLRDDKSYPYLFISQHEFPQITFHRGAKKKKGLYFGPYPSSGAVKESLKLLQKIFPVRQCEDSYYSHRTRPCLQHQIGRCSAPCVGLIKSSAYAEDVHNTMLFLQGKGDVLINTLVAKMMTASERLEFEQAAVVRDQIAKLRTVLEKHFVHGERGDVDIIACAVKLGVACVQVFSIRNGQHLGNQSFFPQITVDDTEAGVLQAFIAQYYLQRPPPAVLVVSHVMQETELLTQVLSQRAERVVNIVHRVRAERLKWLQIAQANADNSLQSQLADKQGMYERYLSLQQELGCQEMPQRLECFDISHTQGEQTVASCVVFDHEGAIKSAYRRFNITNITPGDDCAAIYQAVYRRFKRLKAGEHHAPDILFVDGGVGQVNAAQNALAELALKSVMIVGVSKGSDRKSGMEKLIIPGQAFPVEVTSGASALLLIQQIRDEAHRFAITGHRQRRAKAKKESMLEGIAGLGAKRRQRLLTQFGGLQGVSSAGVDALASIKGISKQLAQQIYDSFHHQDGH